jgi:hypothetical protein
MENNKEHIDSIFRDKLSQQEFEVPSDFVSDIQQRIERVRKKKRRRIFYIWFFGLLILSCTYTTFYGPKSGFFIQKNQPTTSLSPSKINPKITLNKTKQAKLVKNDFIKKHSGVNRVNEEKETNKPNTFNNLKLFNDLNSVAPNYIYKENTLVKTELLVDTAQFYNHTPHQQDIKQNDSSNNLSKRSELLKNRDTTIDVKNSINKNEKEKLNQPTSKKKTRVELQLFSGIQANMLNFESKQNASLLGIKNHNTPSFSAGISGQYLIKNVIFGTGINFNQLTDKYTWNQLNPQIIDSTQISFNLFIPASLDTSGTNFIKINFNETSYLYEDNPSIHTIYNRINVYQVPLFFGYKFQKAKWSFIPKIGLTIGFTRTQVIQFPLYKTTDANIYTDLTSPFVSKEMKSILFTYLLELDIRRQFNGFYLYANPFFKNGINNEIKSNSIKTHMNLGCNFGFGFSF